MGTIQSPRIVSRDEWLDARKALQVKEKGLRPRNMYGQGGVVEVTGRYHQPACACAAHDSAAG